MESGDSITLIDGSTNDSYQLPVAGGTEGPRVIDVRKLYAETGYFTYDPGFTSTASCESQITFIDGDEGRLLHRGYRIELLGTLAIPQVTLDAGQASFQKAARCTLRHTP